MHCPVFCKNQSSLIHFTDQLFLITVVLQAIEIGLIASTDVIPSGSSTGNSFKQSLQT